MYIIMRPASLCLFTTLCTILIVKIISTISPPPIADREVQRILLELLNQMDGFDQSVNVKVNFMNDYCTVYTD